MRTRLRRCRHEPRRPSGRREYLAGLVPVYERQFPLKAPGEVNYPCGRLRYDFRRSFAMTDADHDGTVTHADFVTSCNESPFSTSIVPEPFLTADAARARFALGDTDHDGAWTIAELDATWKPDTTAPWGFLLQPDQVYTLQCTTAPPPSTSMWFRVFDRDADDRATEAEVVSLPTGTVRLDTWPTRKPTPPSTLPRTPCRSSPASTARPRRPPGVRHDQPGGDEGVAGRPEHRPGAL